MTRAPDPRDASTVARALAVLDSFSEDRPVQSLADIVAVTGLSPATAHRYVTELVRWGGIERTARGRYAVSRRLWQFGRLPPRDRMLVDLAQPVLDDLYASTGGVVGLLVLEGDRAVALETLAPPGARTVLTMMRQRLPLHATSPGKVLLAHAPAAVRRRVLSGELARYASLTITDPARLEQELERIRRQGFSLSRNELTEGYTSVAAPVLGPQESVMAAISVIVPGTKPRVTALANAVRVAAGLVSRSTRRR